MSTTDNQVDTLLEKINALADESKTEEALKEAEKLQKALEEKEYNQSREPVQESQTNN